jgi:hypothetical protein
MGTVCNIVVLENYLNVKKIENEKNLQISEMSLQYDYYMKNPMIWKTLERFLMILKIIWRH